MLSFNNSNNIYSNIAQQQMNITFDQMNSINLNRNSHYQIPDRNASQFAYWTLSIEHYYDILRFTHFAVLLSNAQ